MEVANKMQRSKKPKGLVDEEMLRQEAETKMAYIKRTETRGYSKQKAKDELTLMRASCPVKPSNNKSPNARLLSVVDRDLGDTDETRDGERYLPLTHSITDKPCYNR